MAIDFPASPTNGQTFTSGSVTYTYDGTKWTAVAAGGGGSADKIIEGNTSAEVIDTGSDGRFVVTTEGTERLRVNSSGQVGIGTTSPAQALSIGGVSSTPADFKGLAFQSGSTEVNYVRSVVQDGSNYALSFGTYNSSLSEKARLTAAGQLLVGTSSTSPYFDGTANFYSVGPAHALTAKNGGSDSAACQVNWHAAASGNNVLMVFITESSPTVRGTITYNRGAGVVAYNTTSDYRSKTILGDIENPGETIDALTVYRGVMNGATIERPMLVAHEAQEVAPYCVTGEKDAVDSDGNPIYQQMDHQVLVPLLIAEIQQLRARVASLESA